MFKQLDDTQELRQLRDSVADFARREAVAPAAGSGAGTRLTLDPDRWRRMAELGWLAAMAPESAGGLGLGAAEMVVLHQEVGRAAFIEPLLEAGLLSARALAGSDSARLRQELLPRVLQGQALVPLAWQGAAGAISSRDVGPEARLNGDHWQLQGQLSFVAAQPGCEGWIVAARQPEGVLLAWLPVPPEAGPAATLADGTRVFPRVSLQSVRVEASHVIASGARGAELLDDLLDTARLAQGAQLLGLMEQSLQMTLDYIRQRVQFDKPLGSFQSLQHRAVDIYVQIELSRSALHDALPAFGPGARAQERAAAASRIKSRCADAALGTVKQCIQLHGAIAYTEEYALSRYIRRTLTLAAALGNASAHRARYASLVLNPGRD